MRKILKTSSYQSIGNSRPGYRRKGPWTPGVEIQAYTTPTGTGLELLKNTELGTPLDPATPLLKKADTSTQQGHLQAED